MSELRHEIRTGASPTPAMPRLVSRPTLRLAGPDLLRFVAVTLVMICHTEAVPSEYGWFSRLVRGLQRGGWVGVDIFFVLSGFLVSGLLFAEYKRWGEVRIGRFL